MIAVLELNMFIVNAREGYLKSSSPCVSTFVKAFIENVDENIWSGNQMSRPTNPQKLILENSNTL